jgi:hypothetical protein
MNHSQEIESSLGTNEGLRNEKVLRKKKKDSEKG